MKERRVEKSPQVQTRQVSTKEKTTPNKNEEWSKDNEEGKN